MCEAHDLTFEYSDDWRVWKKGCISLDLVRAQAALLPSKAEASRIWNAVVDRKITQADERARFYWPTYEEGGADGNESK